MTVNNPGQPDPEVRKLLQQLVKSQSRTDSWMIVLTAMIAVLTAVLALLAVFH